MNKLFTKIAGLTLGLAMAIGVGVAVASNRKAVPVSAAELVTPIYTLDGTTTGGTNGYATDSEIEQNNVGWIATANTQNNPWRVGGKKISGVDRAIYTTDAISGKVNRISVISGASTLDKVNSLTITVHDSAAEAADGSDVKASKTVTAEASIINETVTLNKADSGYWEGYYYRIVYNVSKSANSNAYVEFKSAVFAKVETVTDATITGESSVEAGQTWTPTGVVDDKEAAVDTTGIEFSFKADNSAEITGNSSTGAFVASAPCTVTVSASLAGYKIANFDVEVTYASPASITLTPSSATIIKSAPFDAKTVNVAINPSQYADQSLYEWIVQSNTVSNDYYWNSGTKVLTAGTTAGTVTLRVRSTSDNTKYTDFVVTISGDPVLTFDKPSFTGYTTDGSTTLTVTPSNFPEGEITYVWSSTNENVITVANVATATNTVTFVGRGNANVKVEAYQGDTSVPENKKAEQTSSITVLKTRNVLEEGKITAAFNFTGITAVGSSDIEAKMESNEFSSDPTVSDTKDKIYADATYGLRMSTGDYAGYLTFDFGTNSINHIKISLHAWSNSENGQLTVTNYATTLTSTTKNSSSPDVFDFDLSSNTSKVTLTGVAGQRVYVRAIEFSYIADVNIAKTSDVVGLENFIDAYLRSDLEYDEDPTNPVNQTTECESLYPNAKNAFNGISGDYKLNNHQRLLLSTNGAYVNEFARLMAWATHAGDSLNESTHVLETYRGTFSIADASSNSSTSLIIVIISLVGLTALGGYFFLRKRKEQ